MEVGGGMAAAKAALDAAIESAVGIESGAGDCRCGGCCCRIGGCCGIGIDGGIGGGAAAAVPLNAMNGGGCSGEGGADGGGEGCCAFAC